MYAAFSFFYLITQTCPLFLTLLFLSQEQNEWSHWRWRSPAPCLLLSRRCWRTLRGWRGTDQEGKEVEKEEVKAEKRTKRNLNTAIRVRHPNLSPLTDVAPCPVLLVPLSAESVLRGSLQKNWRTKQSISWTTVTHLWSVDVRTSNGILVTCFVSVQQCCEDWIVLRCHGSDAKHITFNPKPVKAGTGVFICFFILFHCRQYKPNIFHVSSCHFPLIGGLAAKLQTPIVFVAFLIIGGLEAKLQTPIVLVAFPIIIWGSSSEAADTHCVSCFSYYWGSSSEAFARCSQSNLAPTRQTGSEAISKQLFHLLTSNL